MSPSTSPSTSPSAAPDGGAEAEATWLEGNSAVIAVGASIGAIFLCVGAITLRRRKTLLTNARGESKINKPPDRPTRRVDDPFGKGRIMSKKKKGRSGRSGSVVSVNAPGMLAPGGGGGKDEPQARDTLRAAIPAPEDGAIPSVASLATASGPLASSSLGIGGPLTRIESGKELLDGDKPKKHKSKHHHHSHRHSHHHGSHKHKHKSKHRKKSTVHGTKSHRHRRKTVTQHSSSGASALSVEEKMKLEKAATDAAGTAGSASRDRVRSKLKAAGAAAIVSKSKKRKRKGKSRRSHHGRGKKMGKRKKTMARIVSGKELEKIELAKARGRRSSLEQRLEQFKMKAALEEARSSATPDTRASIATIMTPLDDLGLDAAATAAAERDLDAAAQAAIQAQKKRTQQRLQVRRQSIDAMGLQQ